MRYLEGYAKHLLRNTMIYTAVLAFMAMVVGALAAGDLGNTLIWGLTAAVTLLGAGIGALVALLFLRVVYPALGIDPRRGIRPHAEAEERTFKSGLTGEQATKPKIEYTLQTEDALALHSYFEEIYPRAKRMHRLVLGMGGVSVVVLILAALAVFLVLGRRDLSLVVILVVFAGLDILYWVVGRPILRRRIPKAIARNYARGSKEILRRRKVSIGPEGLTETTDAGQSVIEWSALEYAVFEEQYLFILKPGSATHVVPKRAFRDGESFEEFVRQVSSYCKLAM